MGRISRSAAPRKPVPRGIATTGPAVLSYGFRPFFLLAGLAALFDMVLWIGALSGLWDVGGTAGPIAWHAHEMLFGYASAALCGFVLTAVPNWTGRLPVSGRPLLALVGLWVAGRLVQLDPGLLGEVASAVVDATFLPILAAVVGREVIAGHNPQNLRVAIGISVLGALNIAFHVTSLLGMDEMAVVRLTVALYVLMVSHIGGRIVPSFTRNYLARRGSGRLPRPAGRLDGAALAATLAAGLFWGVLPDAMVTGAVAVVAAALQGARLFGWRGWATVGEPLLLVMHVGYGFVPLGLLAVAGASAGLIAAPSALHVLTVGVIGMMTFAVMTRASRGHTGRPLAASPVTTTAYACLFMATVLRPVAEALPGLYHPILDASAMAWIVAYGLFVLEHAPMLLSRSASPRAPAPQGPRSARAGAA